jgi:hypothetical protein
MASLEVLDSWGSGFTPEREKHALNPEREAMSFRRAKSLILEKYMIRLKGAKFDLANAELVPVSFNPADPTERIAGGSCENCP